MSLCVRRFELAFVLLVVSLQFQPSFASETERLLLWEGAFHTDLLTPDVARSLKLRLSQEFAVTTDGGVIIRVQSGDLFNLGAQESLFARKPLRVSSFTLSDGIVVAVRKNRLGWYESGEILEKIDLPLKEPRVVAGSRQRLYVYGLDGKKSVVYLLDQGQAIRLLDFQDGEISALTTVGERIFLAVDNAIYTAAKGEPAGLLFVAAGHEAIFSLAADPRAGLLYFSAGDSVYAMRAGIAVPVVSGLAGSLRYANSGLYILDARRRRIIKVTGLEKLTMPADRGQSSAAPATGGFKE